MSTISPVRPSPIAGSWYSADPIKLELEIEGYLQHADMETPAGEVMGLIAPHAGYFYSGPTAGYAYRTVKGKSYDLCAVFSPLHDYQPHNLLTSEHQFFTTPFGQIEVDRELVEQCSQALSALTGEKLIPVANDREHSLEIQLPFLQQALAKPFSLLPIMVRTHDHDLLKDTAEALASVLKGKNILLVASTDLSHFLSLEAANKLDHHMMDEMLNFSPEGVLKAERDGSGSACGAGAVALVLWLAAKLGANKVTLLHHSTSAESSGDSRRVVGYGAAAITRV